MRKEKRFELKLALQTRPFRMALSVVRFGRKVFRNIPVLDRRKEPRLPRGIVGPPRDPWAGVPKRQPRVLLGTGAQADNFERAQRYFDKKGL